MDELFDEFKVRQAWRGVWESHPDAVLSRMGQNQFAREVADMELTADEFDEAWYEFREAQERVFDEYGQPREEM